MDGNFSKKEFGLQEKAAMQIDLPDYRPATRPSYTT